MAKAKDDEKMERFREALDTNFPELVAYFKVTEDGKHVFEFYKKMEETIAVYKGTRTRKWLELVGVLEKTKSKDTTACYKPTYIADAEHTWFAILNIVNNLHNVYVDTNW